MPDSHPNPLPPTEPITLPMHDKFGDYFNQWVHDAQEKNAHIRD